MLIKITEKCSMECPHCMNNATANGKEMELKTFIDTLNFINKKELLNNTAIIITGGEPTEHSKFVEFMEILANFYKEEHIIALTTVTTNGFWCLENQEEAKRIISLFPVNSFIFQVSADIRYYPKRLDITKRIFREKGFVLCDDCVEVLYPQGRALQNFNNKCSAYASKCFNIRAISKQISNPTLKDIISSLASINKFCTPHIKINGDIGLGESDLCPTCASIYDEPKDIVEKIINFKCSQCNHINDKLSPKYKQFL